MVVPGAGSVEPAELVSAVQGSGADAIEAVGDGVATDASMPTLTMRIGADPDSSPDRADRLRVPAIANPAPVTIATGSRSFFTIALPRHTASPMFGMANAAG